MLTAKKLASLALVWIGLILWFRTCPAQTPVTDLWIQDAQIQLVGPNLVIETTVAVLDLGMTSGFTTTLNFYLDMDLVASLPFEVLTSVPSTCPDFQPPNCGYGYCEEKTINGQPTQAACVHYDFPAPVGDCCGCLYLSLGNNAAAAYEDQETCRIVVDEGGTVTEVDEQNNTATIDLAPVADQPSTWSAVKALYR